MKLSNFSIPVLRDAFSQAISRFPLALISAFAFGLMAIYLIEFGDTSLVMQRILFCLAIGLPWLMGLHLIGEKYLNSSSQKGLLFLCGIAFLVLVYFFIAPDFAMDHLERPVRFFSFFLIAHLLVSLAPFFRPGKIKEFWEYNKDALVTWYIGSFYAVILFLGLLIGLVAIDNLFEIHVKPELYLEIFIIIASVFHPIHILSNFPKADGSEPIQTAHTKTIRNLCFYILIPLTILYFVILYAYGLKIVITSELPKGWVSSLILGFSGIGMISYLLNYHLPDLEESKLSSLFKKYFFYILAPLVILLFVAINRRLSDYGFTPPRYFILITGIWLFISCIYFIISKTNNIKLIPMSLIIFLLIGTMSPFDAFHVSINSQYNRLVSLLEKDKAFENGKIKASLASLDYPERESIKKIIYALDQMGALKKVNSLLSDPVLFDTIKYYDSRDFLFEKIGLSVRSEIKDEGKTIYLSSSEKNDYVVAGYERIFIFNLYKEASDENIILQEMNGMSVIVCKKLQDTIPLTDLLIKVDERNTKSGPDDLLNEPYDISTKVYKHRLYIKNLNYQKKESKLTIDYLQAVLLSGKN